MSKLADETFFVKELGPLITWLQGPHACESLRFDQSFADFWANRGDDKTLQMRLRSAPTPTTTQDTLRFSRWDDGSDEDIPDQVDAFSIVVHYFDLAAP